MYVRVGLNKWVEVGNSGVFRPEMLLPMGLPADVSVIAWGLSLERYAAAVAVANTRYSRSQRTVMCDERSSSKTSKDFQFLSK